MNEQKLKKLQSRKENLEEKYYEACQKEHERINNMGWGYGMRNAKINFSTRKSDELREKIEKCNKEIQECINEMQSHSISTILTNV